MAIATNQQIQQFVNERVRPRAEQIRALLLAMEDDRAAFDDIYEALATNSNPNNWADDRPDGPPHLLTASDVLAWNTFLYNAVTAFNGDAQLPVVLKGCVRPVSA